MANRVSIALKTAKSVNLRKLYNTSLMIKPRHVSQKLQNLYTTKSR